MITLEFRGQAPVTSAFCLGVWKYEDHNNFKLNHFAIAWNATGTELVGPVNIREEIQLDPDHDHYTGRFVIDAYDGTGKAIQHAQGNVAATRMDVDTPAESIF